MTASCSLTVVEAWRMRLMQCGLAAACMAGLAGLGQPAHAQSSSEPPSASASTPSEDKVSAVTVASGLDHPWSIAFLPGFEQTHRALVTERPGRLRVVDLASGELSPPLAGMPKVYVRGQGGLLDVALDPRFADNSLVYLSYSEPGEGGSGIAVARARIDLASQPAQLKDLKIIVREKPKVRGSANLGSRLAFAPDGRLFVTVGDRFDLRDQAQDLSVSHGKILRIESDGRIPADNPFVKRQGALPEIYTYGHRNPEGAAINPATGELWTQEHGPQGGDEVNIERAGHNYGWPVITYGGEYGSGAQIGEGTAKPGMDQPITKWVPSIAPSGMAFLSSDRYPGWKGNLFIGALKAQMLVRLTFDGERVVGEEHMLQGLGERIRDVRQGPDGWLYILTDNPQGRVLRLDPR